MKQGFQHVEPPFEIIENMITMRIHLDDVTVNNAPLLIAIASHKLGKIKQSEIDSAINDFEYHECIANAGDIWLYSTPIIHASKRSNSSARRRVLQIDFSKDQLPNGLGFLEV